MIPILQVINADHFLFELLIIVNVFLELVMQSMQPFKVQLQMRNSKKASKQSASFRLVLE